MMLLGRSRPDPTPTERPMGSSTTSYTVTAAAAVDGASEGLRRFAMSSPDQQPAGDVSSSSTRRPSRRTTR
jgi:hypothetical protein